MIADLLPIIFSTNSLSKYYVEDPHNINKVYLQISKALVIEAVM